MDKIETLFLTIISAITIGLFAFIMGKKKEDISIALNYQEYYDKFITALKGEISELKIEVIEMKMRNNEQQVIIDSQKENINRWESNCERLEVMLNNERNKH